MSRELITKSTSTSSLHLTPHLYNPSIPNHLHPWSFLSMPRVHACNCGMHADTPSEPEDTAPVSSPLFYLILVPPFIIFFVTLPNYLCFGVEWVVESSLQASLT